MFKFTTTTIINTVADEDNLARFSTSNKQLVFPFVGNFKASNVENKTVYKSATVPETMATAAITIATPVKGDSYRIKLYIRAMNSQDPIYANDFVFKGRPFYIEAIAPDATAASLAKAFKTNADTNMLLLYQKNILNISVAGDVITFTGTEGIQEFQVAVEQHFDYAYGVQVAGTTQGDWTDIASATITHGNPGFGTYKYLMQNFRLPTAMNTCWTAINQEEKPQIGTTYNEYIFKYCTNRGIMGLSAVGEPVKSLTSHVFWVNTALTTDFEKMITDAGLTVTAIPDTTPDASLEDDSAVDLENDVNKTVVTP